MKIRYIVYTTNMEGRALPHVTVLWEDDKANSFEVQPSNQPQITGILKAVQLCVNARLEQQ